MESVLGQSKIKRCRSREIMKTKIIHTVDLAEGEPERYPYPKWSTREEEVLERWYPVLGCSQCVEMWQLLTGRLRRQKQIDHKAFRMGIQNLVPDDWFELFDEVK